MIILDKPFSIGDRIGTSSVEGTVEEITYRSTKVRTFAQALVTVPNSTMANEAITNWSKMGRRRITFNLGVTYTTPRFRLETCIARIEKMLREHPQIHQETIFVNFDRFNESSLDIFLYFFTVTTNWGEYLKVREDAKLRNYGHSGGGGCRPASACYCWNLLTRFYDRVLVKLALILK